MYVGRGVTSDSLGVTQREGAGEGRQGAQKHRFVCGQEIVAPVQRRAQGHLPRGGGAPTWPGQPEPGVEQGKGGSEPEGPDPPGGEFDRQGDAIQLAADVGDQPGVFKPGPDRAPARRRPLGEELHRRVAPYLLE